MIKPRSGKIQIDDKEISNEYERRKFQNLITFISQDTFLIEDTIKNNITFTTQNQIDEKKLNNAIKLACAEKFIHELPDNLNYMVGTHGRKISSGQKQRIMNTQIMDHIGWSPKYSLKTGLEETISWFLDNRKSIRQY